MYITIGYLRDNYPRLYDIAYKSARKLRSEIPEEELHNLNVSYMENWENTDQGIHFWISIHDGKFRQTMKDYPEWAYLFDTSSLELETKNNGLWQ